MIVLKERKGTKVKVSKVDKLAKATPNTCFYISREHLRSQIAEHLKKWKKEFPEPFQFFRAYLQNHINHSLLLYASVFTVSKIDIDAAVDRFIDFARNGSLKPLHDGRYDATISLIGYASHAKCKKAIRSFLNLDIPKDFEYLDLYPTEELSKTILFNSKGI